MYKKVRLRLSGSYFPRAAQKYASRRTRAAVPRAYQGIDFYQTFSRGNGKKKSGQNNQKWQKWRHTGGLVVVLTHTAAEVLPSDATGAAKRQHVDFIPLPAVHKTERVANNKHGKQPHRRDSAYPQRCIAGPDRERYPGGLCFVSLASSDTYG